jgi:predicted outer membrane protein
MSAHSTRKLVLLCLLLAACNRDEEQPAEQLAEDTAALPPPPAPLSDNQALDVLMAMSSAGVEAASAPTEQITTAEVRRYLGVVRADHTALQAELKVIADSLQLVPETHAAGDRVRAAARDGLAVVGQQTGPADVAALEQQVRLHRLLLGVLDSAVLRGPRQPLLAQYAGAVRPTVSAHLQRGEQLARLLASRPPVSPVRSRPTPAPMDTPPRPRPAAIETGRRPRPDSTTRR